MRVAMVLDNTGSMAQNGKMAAMQNAAKNMIDTLSGYNKQTGDVYVSIVPFAKDVNVGTSNVNASWINWTEWETEPPVLTQNNYPISVTYNGINYTWADIGPARPACSTPPITDLPALPTAAGNFQMIASSSQTADAFQNILAQISKLRVAQ
jgi:hypothetical protein